MKTPIILGVLISFLLLTTVSAYVPGPGDMIKIDPGLVFDPGLVIQPLQLPCSCKVDVFSMMSSCTVNGCAGSKSCVEGACTE